MHADYIAGIKDLISIAQSKSACRSIINHQQIWRKNSAAATSFVTTRQMLPMARLASAAVCNIFISAFMVVGS